MNYDVVDTLISPEGRLEVLSKAEVSKLLDTSQGGLDQIFRKCALAVLNAGSSIDDGKELLERYKDFDIKIIQRERGIKLDIRGAASESDAQLVARAIAHSPLCKTAWSSADPNWGRLIAAAGYSGADFDPAQTRIWVGDQPVFEYGGRARSFNEAAAHHAMSAPEYTIRIDLGAGNASTQFLTCDLTAEYVRINADYST